MKPYVIVPMALLLLSTASIAVDWQALPTVAPAPADNPTTPAKVELGKMLYFDPRLSSSGTVSCFSCHNVMEGGDDHRSTSVGVHGQIGGRNAPTVWNAAFLSVQFWDGRAPTLEAQAKGPIANPIEMGMKMGLAVERIQRIPGYQTLFEQVFGATTPSATTPLPWQSPLMSEPSSHRIVLTTALSKAIKQH